MRIQNIYDDELGKLVDEEEQIRQYIKTLADDDPELPELYDELDGIREAQSRLISK